MNTVYLMRYQSHSTGNFCQKNTKLFKKFVIR